MKKIEFTLDQITEMKRLYVDEIMGTPSIGKIFKVHPSVIANTLRSNGVVLDQSGRRNTGGKVAADKRYYIKNKETISEYYKDWVKDKRENLRVYHENWRKGNEKYKQSRNDYERKRRQEDPKYRLMKYTQTALWACLKERNIRKTSSTFKLLGYTLEEIICHLEKQFTVGMSWENYGEWHVDHIIPMSKFDFSNVTDYEFMQCWSLNNLRPMWCTTREINGQLYEGNLNKGAKHTNSCYQFRIRERKKIEEKDLLGFDLSSVSIANCEVRMIEKKIAKNLIEEYEWLGFMPSYTKYHFGIFFKVGDIEILGGAVVFQDDYVENVGGWDKYDFSKKIILLSRGVCIWWTPKNAASFLISKALDWLSKNTHYKIVTATVDELAGEIGTIYQACNWVYVGVMEGNILSNGKERERLGVIIDGKLHTSRQIRDILGTMKKEVILQHYPEAKFIKQKAKARYFYFLGSKNDKKYHLSRIAYQVKPYPKR